MQLTRALAPARAGNGGRQLNVAVKAVSDVKSAGARAINPSSLQVQRIMGQGSFGEVFQGTWKTPSGEQRVVLKRVKAKVEGAQEMGQMELLLNAYAAKVARSHCADFLGYCEVSPEESTSRLTAGLWLMWRYEGSRTLAYYLRRRDTLRALANDLEVAGEDAALATVMKQMFECLAAFHAAGLVHRDVKPLNIIFAEDNKRVKLIDLGACADLRTGTNYVPDESILDPNYCPPEQYVLPTDSPHLAKSMLKLAISPMLWAQHKPDRFDMWSAGVTMLQLAVPSMRQDRFLRNFNTQYGAKFDYDLDAWRANSFIPVREFELLDADGGSGWELVKALLRPRSIKNMPDGTVAFVNDSSQPRISAGEALRHRFIRQAREPGSSYDEDPSTSYTAAKSGAKSGSSKDQKAGSGGQKAGSGGSSQRPGSAQKGAAAGSANAASGAGEGKASKADSFGAAVGVWRALTNKLFDLEANILVTASATEKQTTVVKKLQKKVAKGEVEAQVLKKEEKKLMGMEKQLTGLQEDFNSTANAVSSVLGFLGFGSASKGSSAAPSTPASSSSSSGGSGAKGKAAPSKRATTPTSSLPSASGSSGEQGGNRAWKAVQARMAQLEVKLSNQMSAVDKQSFTVKKLRQGVGSGAVDEAALRRAEQLLERMEKRAAALETDVKSTRQESAGLLRMLGLGGSSKPSTRTSTPMSSSPPTPPASSTKGKGPSRPVDKAVAQAAKVLDVKQGQQPAAAAPQPASGGGFGGFLGRLFGGSAPSKTAQPATPAPTAAAQKAAPTSSSSPSKRGTVAPATASFSAASGDSLDGGSDAGQTGGTQAGGTQLGKDITEGANALIVNSIKFTGMAAKVALGMAVAMKNDAEKVLREMEVEAEKRRQRRDAEQAFLRMLGAMQPPMKPYTTMDDVVAAVGKDPRFLAVEEAQRPMLVGKFIDALQTAQLRAKAAAEGKLRDLYRQLLNTESVWDEVEERLATNTVFAAVEDPITRAALFDEVVTELKLEEEGRVAARRSEAAFRELLEQLDSPAIAPGASWPLVKPQVWKDPRYLAVPESRRRDIFNEVLVAVTAVAEARAVSERAKAASEADRVAEILAAAGGEEAVDGGLIEDLRKEQARLRTEYDKMEAKLREMEAALAAKERSVTRSPSPLPPDVIAAASAAAAAAAPTDAAAALAATSTTKRIVRRIATPGPSRGGAAPPVAGGTVKVRAVAAGAGGALPGSGGSAVPDAAADVAQTLQSAGVMLSRMSDGTLVFSFENEERGQEGSSGTPPGGDGTLN